MEKEKPVDFLDREIEIGDTIVYATSRSSNVEMHKAVVTDITFKKSYTHVHDGEDENGRWKYKRKDYMQASLKIHAFRKSYKGGFEEYDTTIHCWDRVVILEKKDENI